MNLIPKCVLYLFYNLIFISKTVYQKKYKKINNYKFFTLSVAKAAFRILMFVIICFSLNLLIVIFSKISKQVYVLLMDCQGSNHKEKAHISQNIDAMINSIGLHLSTKHIFNVSGLIDDSHRQTLEVKCSNQIHL